MALFAAQFQCCINNSNTSEQTAQVQTCAPPVPLYTGHRRQRDLAALTHRLPRLPGVRHTAGNTHTPAALLSHSLNHSNQHLFIFRHYFSPVYQ